MRVDCADPGGGREHDREEAVDTGENDFRFRSNAEPGGEDRIEDDDRHRVERGEHRQQQVAQQRNAADQCARQDADATGDQHREGDLVERDGQLGSVFAPILDENGERFR